MRNKRFVIWILGLVNVLLLGGLLSLCLRLPEAHAQQRRAGAAGKYAAVTAEFTEGTDALYLLHSQQRRLTVLVPDQNQNGRLVLAYSRDIGADLGG